MLMATQRPGAKLAELKRGRFVQRPQMIHQQDGSLNSDSATNRMDPRHGDGCALFSLQDHLLLISLCPSCATAISRLVSLLPTRSRSSVGVLLLLSLLLVLSLSFEFSLFWLIDAIVFSRRVTRWNVLLLELQKHKHRS
jgi:hypothetical protein